MLKKLNKNSGMSLIEVIVSMLVLSIAVVAVTMSFTAASNINLGSRQKQSIESLMENLMEYAESGGTDYKTWFNVTAANYDSDTDDADEDKLIETLGNVSQGLYKYDVRVTTDSSPDEYAGDKLNGLPVIQFGSANSSTVMIDASLKSYDVSSTTEFGDNVSDYDETAYNHFFIRHSQAVLEANLAGAEPPLDVTPIEQIPNFVDRELRLVVSMPTADKMQLTAYLTYMLDDSILLPSGIDYEFNGLPLFESEMYDLPTDTNASAKKLSQIYIMYSKAALEPENIGFNQDIRIMDPAHVMKANIFIAKQQETATLVENVLDKDLGTGRDTTLYNVRVSFRKPQEGTTESYHPAGGDFYCSGNVELQDETSYTATTKLYDNNLVAKGNEVRIVTTTLEILKQGTDTVLASKKVTHLQ